jgi:2'-deoxynucleoside 5'-phosphate N-hydrolase
VAATIYFSGSISGGRADVAQYRRIVDELTVRGFRVLAGSVTATDIGRDGDPLPARDIFTRDLGWLEQADAVVAEVSLPSTGVGYEIAAARYRFSIPVVCLYRPAYTARCSAMVAGDPEIALLEYDDTSFEAMLRTLVNKLQDLTVTRACLP